MSRLRLRRSLLAMLVGLAVFATACGGGSDAAVATQSTADDSAAAPAESTPAESEAEPAISLVASTVDGGQIDFGSLEGQDVVLWFWAPW